MSEYFDSVRMTKYIYAFGGKKQAGAIIRAGAIIGTNMVCSFIQIAIPTILRILSV